MVGRGGRWVLWLQAAVVMASLGLFLLVSAEIVARVYSLARGDLAVPEGQKAIFRLDSEAGYTMKPNSRIRLVTAEYDQVLETNSRGLVGPEIPEKTGDEFRVVVLGDSTTAAGQVQHNDSYTALLERLLHEAGHPNVRVINAAVGGWSTFNQSGFLRANRAWLEPDLVVVASTLGNDIAENVFATRGGYVFSGDHPDGITWGPDAAALLRASADWFPSNGVPLHAGRHRWDPDDPIPTPVPNPVPPSNPRDAPAAAGAPASSGDSWPKLSDLARRHSVAYQLWLAHRGPATLNLSAFAWLLLPEYPDVYWVQLAWPLTERYLVQIKETAEADRARTVLMLVPDFAQFDRDAYQELLNEYGFHDGDLDLDRPQQEFRLRAGAHGIPVLDLLPAFRTHPRRGELYFRRDRHFTALGHQAVAQQLTAFIEPLIRPGAPRS